MKHLVLVVALIWHFWFDRNMKFIVLFLFLIGSKSQCENLACEKLKKFPEIVKNELKTKERRSSSGFGVALISPSTGEVKCSFFHNANLNVYTGSSIKTLIAIAVLKDIDSHRGKLSELIKIDQPNAKEECFHWDCDQYGPGKEKTIEQLLTDMIVVSNNLATNQLISWVSKDKINELAKNLDASGLRVLRRVYDEVNPEPKNSNRNQANAIGMVALYREIIAGHLKILSESSRNFLTTILLKHKYNNRLNGDFPSNLKFYHKTGNTSQSSSDAGFFHLDSETDVILVGLQGFHDFDSLKRIGKRTISALGIQP